jgi:Eukaryotic aspartyl protease
MASVLESPLAGLNIYQETEGPITFGYLDSTQYEGDLTWIPVDTTKQSEWNAATVYYSLDGVPTNSSAGLSSIMGKPRT